MCIVTDNLPKTLQTPFLIRRLRGNFSNDVKAFLEYINSPLPVDYLQHLNETVQVDTEAQMLTSLRQQRNKIMAHIAARELLQLDDIRTSCFALSTFADGCLWFAHNFYHPKMVERFGAPISENDGTEQSLIILGMGKLGGQELNFSSDIDLIFAFNQKGKTNHPKSHRAIENSEFFIRLSKQIVNALNNLEHEGFVFRVDTRLRPYGKSGPMACGFETLELYFLHNARPWERFALGKARPITGSKKDWDILIPMFESFVYRRYTDFSILEDLRDTKAMIKNKLLQNISDQWNVKLGTGGIREVEFFLQSKQLIYAGKQRNLRCRGVFESLEQFIPSGLLSRETSETLPDDYRFLRKLEQRIQYWNDDQTHLLPNDEAHLNWLIESMGAKNADEFNLHIKQVRTRVTDEFHELLFNDIPAEATIEWISMSNIDSLYNEIFRSGYSFTPSQRWLELIVNFNQSRVAINASTKSKHHMNTLYSIILKNPLAQNYAVLDHVLKVLSTTIQRSNYLALLVERTNILELVITVVSKSSFLAEELQKHPSLLDSMVVPSHSIVPSHKVEMMQMIDNFMLHVPSNEIENKLNLLKEFKRAMVFRIAFSNINQTISIHKTSLVLSWLAYVVIRKSLDVAITMMQGSRPIAGLEDYRKLPLIIVGYGKAGSGEMGLGSDLDIVLIYDKNHEKFKLPEDWFLRLTRKLIQVLSASSVAGFLYEIDTRLRPDGKSGTMIVSLEQFQEYQLERAQTWERQSLVKARPIAGESKLAGKFNRFRRKLICTKVDENVLREEILEMRQKMRESLDKTTDECFDIKHGPGGLVDAEFITQYLVLKNAWQFPEIASVRSVHDQLSKIAKVLPEFKEGAHEISENYLKLRQMGMDCSLQNESTLITKEQVGGISEVIYKHWRKIFGDK